MEQSSSIPISFVKSSIARRLCLLIAVLSSCVFVSLAICWNIVARVDPAVLGLAHLQEMRAHEFGDWTGMVASGQNEDRTGLRERIATFDKMLPVLEEGCLKGILGPSLPDATIPTAAARVRALWSELKPKLLVIADRPATSPEFIRTYPVLLPAIETLRAHSGEVATLLEDHSRAQRVLIFRLLTLTAAVSTILLALGLWYAVRFIVRPVLQIESAARQLRDGNLSVRVVVPRESDLSIMGKTFNEMASKIQDLLLTRDQLARFSEENPGPILRCARDGKILYVNPGGKALLDSWDLQPGDCLPDNWLNIVVTCLASGASLEELPSGDSVYEFLIVPIAGGNCCNLYGRDITRRKRAEEELIMFRELMDQSNDAIEVADPETGRLIIVNRTACLSTDYTREELLTMSVPDLYPSCMDFTLWQQAVGNIRKSGFQLIEGERRRKDGSTYPVEVGVKYVVLDRAYLIAVVRDISGRKQAEDQLRLQSAVMNSTANGIIVTDPHGTIEWVNPAFSALTGYTAEEAIGLKPQDLVKSGQHEPAFYKNMWDTIHSGQVWHGEIINRKKDGSLYTEEQTITPVLNESGNIMHIIGIKYDITERKKLEEQFNQAQKLESVGQLAGGVAHDFNNLLSVIMGYADFALQTLSEDDPLRADIQQIRNAGDRAAVLTRQLLAFSRKQVMKQRILGLNEVVSDTQKMLQRLIGENIELVFVPGEYLGRVKADPGQIDQVLMNLAVNARDAMPDGGKLTIETSNVHLDDAYAASHLSATPGSYVRLVVSDTGIGMNEATLQRIFEPFFTTKEMGKGTGLGLATVYGIVKQSGGNIWVYSEIGKGTAFKIYLPRTDEEVQEARSVRAEMTARGTETILVVEDEETLRNLTQRILKSAGYTVLSAANGGDALLMLEHREESVHLLITDVIMPGMSGRDLAERFAKLHPKQKVLYMSGYTDDTIVRHGVLEESVHFIGKPFSTAELTRKAREVLDTPEPEDGAA